MSPGLTSNVTNSLFETADDLMMSELSYSCQGLALAHCLNVRRYIEID